MLTYSHIRGAALHFIALFLCVVLPADVRGQPRPALVDLTDQQTPFRNQGGRTCIVHSVTAAMEAALKRANGGNPDLSEETFMYFVKMFWLKVEPVNAADETENQVGGGGGGNGLENLRYLKGWLAIPAEADGWADGHSVVPADKRAEWAGLTGEGVVAMINKADPLQCGLTIPAPDGRAAIHFTGRLLSRERGVVAGGLTSGEPAKSKAIYGAALVR